MMMNSGLNIINNYKYLFSGSVSLQQVTASQRELL